MTTKDSSELMAHALEAADLIAWEADLDTRRIAFSPNAAAVVGFPLPSDAFALVEMVHPDDRDEVVRHLMGAVEQGRLAVTARLVNPGTGAVAWVETRGRAVVDRPVPGMRLTGIIRNVTEEKERERALRDEFARVALHARRFDAIASAAEDFIYSFDQDARFTYLSQRVLDLFGVTYDQAIGKNMWELGYPPEVAEKLTRQVKHVVETGQPIRDETMPLAFAGGEAAYEYIFTPILDSEGNAEGVAGISRDMTTRRQFEEQLRASEERYRSLFNSIDEGFCVIEMIYDDDGNPVDYLFLEVNPAFERHTTMKDAAGKRMREFVPNHEESWFEIYGRVAETGETIRFINQAAALGGRWFDLNAFRVGGPESKRVAVLFTDITERKMAEEAVRHSEARLRRALDIETVGVIFFKPDGAITYANPAFLRMSGYDQADVEAGRVRWDIMTPPEWLAESRRMVRDLFGHGRCAPYEKEYIRKDGSRWWGMFAAARLDEDEAVEFIIDITETKRTELERARLASIVESSQDAIFRCGVDGTIVDWNRGAEQLFGYTAAEIVGKNVRLLIPKSRAEEPSRIVQTLLRGEEVQTYETERRRKDGSLVQVEIRPSAIRNLDGELVGIAVIGRDVTARKRLEQAQEDFLAMASHDLRSPVTVLRGRAQLMRRRKSYDEAAIEVILEQAQRIDRLVSDLQSVVQLEASEFKLHRGAVDLAKLAREAVARVTAQGKARIALEAPPEPIVGDWDRDRLAQVFDNLLGNAVKYTPPDTGISIRIGAADGEATFTVADRGPGIPGEALPRLFDRFYRADQSGRSSGMGLGLYIARMLVEAHGGRIAVESREGEGSAFTVTLPIG